MNRDAQTGVLAGLEEQTSVYPISPQWYLAFIDLMCCSIVIVTDSGGIQEEPPSLGKPMLATREAMERPDMLRTGLVHIVGNRPRRLTAKSPSTWTTVRPTAHPPTPAARAVRWSKLPVFWRRFVRQSPTCKPMMDKCIAACV